MLLLVLLFVAGIAIAVGTTELYCREDLLGVCETNKENATASPSECKNGQTMLYPADGRRNHSSHLTSSGSSVAKLGSVWVSI